SVRPLTDQEEVARIFSKYDLFALPVTDEGGKILGIITVDDVVDVLEEESTEDIQKMGAVEPLEAPYLETAFTEVLRKRASWLVVLFVGQFFTSTAMKAYEDELAVALELALFIPLVISSGGNSGSQSSTLIIRAMSLAQVQPKDWYRVIFRELGMGLLLGLLLGVIGLGRAYWMGIPSDVALTIGVSVVGIVLSGSIVGSLLPMALRRFGLDPAVSSAPLIASLVDVAGLVLYFTVAKFFIINRVLH
ncbi:MAG: magnesium transporter, partial [Myxococcales bacterium]